MNKGHSLVVSWAFQFLPFSDGQKLLDIGCGGGANIARLLAQYPSSVVDGVDYSQHILLSKKNQCRRNSEKMQYLLWKC